MGTRKIFLSVVFILTAISGYSKEPRVNNNGGYFIVSRYGGMAATRHATFISIGSNDLRYDTSHRRGYVPKDISELNFTVLLPAAQFDKVKDIPFSVPAELLSNPGKSFGQMQIDGVTTCVWATVNGKKYKWGFQSDQSKSSPEVKQFYSRLCTL